MLTTEGNVEMDILESHKVSKPSKTWRRLAFLITWVLADVVLGLLLIQGQHSFALQPTLISLVVLLLCTASLLWWIPNPIRDGSSNRVTNKGRFVLVMVATAGILFLLHKFVGAALLMALPILAVIVLVLLKQPIEQWKAMYALALALLAGVAGLGVGGIRTFTPVEWSILQVLLVLTGLLAGWSILQHWGLSQRGVGHSRFLTEGVPSTARGFVQGILLGMPWALGNVVMGGSHGDTWVKAWWQPIVAIQPGIAEEAWARILLVPLLFLIFRHVSPTRLAFTSALVIAGYWFAYLHTSGGLGAIPMTLVLGTLYSLPISYLCLYRDLETAIGFHFWIDFVRFVSAFILLNG